MKNKEDKENGSLFWIPLIACLAAVFASFSAFISARQTELANKVKLRPYVMIMLESNDLEYNGPPHIVLPYKLGNVGAAPALNVLKGYTSYLIEQSGEEIIIRDRRELPKEVDAILPSQVSARHDDNIDISKFDLSKIDNVNKIRVELKITYQGFPEVDKRTYYSKSLLELFPKITPSGRVRFLVTQPKLDFGFENLNKETIFAIPGFIELKKETKGAK